MQNKFKVFAVLPLLFLITSKDLFGQSGWVQQNSGISRKLMDVFFINADTSWVVGDRGKILHTTNGGEQWNRQTSGTTKGLCAVYFIDSRIGWIVGREGLCLSTTDGGSTWIDKSIVENEASYDLRDVFFLNESIGWMCGHNVYKTVDGGNNWSKLLLNPEYYRNIEFVNADTGWAAGGRIYKTVNGGVDWTGSIDINTHSMFLNGIDTVFAVGSSHMPKVTYNGGQEWQDLSHTLPVLRYDCIFFSGINVGYTSGLIHEDAQSPPHSQVLKTTDGGATWNIIIDTIDGLIPSIYFIDDTVGWIVGNNGMILKTTTGGSIISTSSTDENILPINFDFIEVYPNPFSSSITLRYILEKQEHITIGIYNAEGQEIETLINRKQIAGEYEITWQPKRLPAGVYFVKLQVGGLMETKKLVLKN